MSTSMAVCGAMLAALLALVPATLVAALVDARRLDGANLWSKPLKFEVSLIIHFLTLTFAMSALSAGARDSAVMQTAVWAAALSTVFEMAYIIVQAARCAHSHFNLTTPFHAAMYALMAIGAVLICASYAAVAWLAYRDARDVGMSPMRVALIVGLASSCVTTLLTGFAMGSRLRRHVGHHDPARGTMPFTGWSRSAGDLRVPHFVANHSAQVVLTVGWLLASAPLTGAALAIVATAGACCVAVWLSYRRAMRAQYA